MRLKSLALALSTAGLLAAIPAAPASADGPWPDEEPWPPGNCQQGTFCAWPNWAPVNSGPTETPSLVTTGPWTGSAPTKTFYNYTTANVELEYHHTWQDDSTVITHCATPRGNIFYLQVIVTKVNWHGSC
ncbi:hypothetical protein ACGFIP_20200 [Micromonospora zamorensis]|uniref:hypothetical protein n=1 Tax=Micromonospora zamorensis TaxID=709883 RepID=UPI0037195129